MGKGGKTDWGVNRKKKKKLAKNSPVETLWTAGKSTSDKVKNGKRKKNVKTTPIGGKKKGNGRGAGWNKTKGRKEKKQAEQERSHGLKQQGSQAEDIGEEGCGAPSDKKIGTR